MRQFATLLVLGFALFAVACGRGGGDSTARADPSPATGPGRRVEVRVSGMEFTPSKVDARAGERLDLVFTREAGPSCVTSIIFEGGPTKELPENTPVTVSVTAPPSGTMSFACPYGHARGQVRVQ